MLSIYFGAHQCTRNGCAFKALQYAKASQASCFPSQMYFGGTGCKSSCFRRVHGMPGANKCGFGNPGGTSRLGSRCSSTLVQQSNLLKTKTYDGICVWKHTAVTPNMCQHHWSLLLSRPQTRGKAGSNWLKDQHHRCGLAVRWQHESSTSGHHRWLPGTSTSYSNLKTCCKHLSPLQDFGLACKELTFGAESIIHVWVPITIPNDRFLITQLQSLQKCLGKKWSFTWCFK